MVCECVCLPNTLLSLPPPPSSSIVAHGRPSPPIADHPYSKDNHHSKRPAPRHNGRGRMGGGAGATSLRATWQPIDERRHRRRSSLRRTTLPSKVSAHPPPFSFLTQIPGATSLTSTWQPNDKRRHIRRSSSFMGEHPHPNLPTLTHRQTTRRDDCPPCPPAPTNSHDSPPTPHNNNTGTRPASRTHHRPLTPTMTTMTTTKGDNGPPLPPSTHQQPQQPTNTPPQTATGAQHHPRHAMTIDRKSVV